MRKNIFKLISVLLCCCLLLSFTACSSKPKNDGASSTVSGGVDPSNYELKYSTDCLNWQIAEKDSKLFKADGKYAAGETEIVYLNVKNLSKTALNYKLSLSSEGTAGGALYGYTDKLRSAYTDSALALDAVKVKSYAVGSGYVFSEILEAESAVTFAIVVYVPQGAAAADVKLKLDLSAVSVDISGVDNSSKVDNGKTIVYANAYGIVEDSTKDFSIANTDSTFKVTFKKGAVKQGSVVSAVVKPTDTADTYSITVLVDGVVFTGEAKISILAGYGYSSAPEVTFKGSKLTVSYSKYGGMADFTVTANGDYTINSKGGVLDAAMVGVQGFDDKMFTRFDEAVKFVSSQPADEIGESVTFVIFSQVRYLVEEGEILRFMVEGSGLKNITVVGGTPNAEILIDGASGSLPSLPIADIGVQITYKFLTFDSEKTTDVTHFDYRGDADASYIGCTFKRAIANRGDNSNIVVDGCTFACKEQSDTFKGYCYYTVALRNDGAAIKVRFTNNTIVDSWGGINMDWGRADFYIAGNTFANMNCSKPAIQLSRAKTMVIENNKISNIVDENAFRFYGAYLAESTHITNNELDADYLFYSDKPETIISLQDFVFEDNIISERTNLTLGHITNSPADQVSAHGYVVDTDLNKIK